MNALANLENQDAETTGACQSSDTSFPKQHDPNGKSKRPRCQSATPRFQDAKPRCQSATPRLQGATPRFQDATPRFQDATPLAPDDTTQNEAAAPHEGKKLRCNGGTPILLERNYSGTYYAILKFFLDFDFA